MKLSNLLFKRKISILGVFLFVSAMLIKISYKFMKTIIKIIIRTLRWLCNYIHFIKSNYSYNDIYHLINSFSGREFEKFIYYSFKELGYKVKLTQSTNDGGKDLILYDKKLKCAYVECKRWNYEGSFKVGRPELQKLVGSAIGDNIDNMLFITTGQYSNEAYDYSAKIEGLILWDIKDIMKLVYKVDQKKIPKILMKSLNYTNTKITRLKYN